MGILISRFRKNKTTIEILEDLDKKIKDIESYGQSTEQQHKRIVGILILYSVALYVITVAIFYFYFFPASFYDLMFFIIPLLAFPIFIFISKKLISWYYKRKISRNQEKLDTMQKQKKKILDDVTETETYKKAKEILMKFAPDQLRTPLTTSPQMNRTVVLSSQAGSAGDTPRRAPAIAPESATITDSNFLRRRALTAATAGPNSQFNRISGTPGGLPSGVSNVATPPAPYPPGNRQFGSPVPLAHNPLPRPILPQQRSYLDKLVEYLVGDGPSNRYALICRQCDSHNGMALREEFEYFAFRCVYCNSWNPARKQKPSAPKLELDHTSVINQSSLSLVEMNKTVDKLPTSKSEDSIVLSESDSDIEVVEKPNEEENDDKSSQKSEEEGNESVEKPEVRAIEKMEVDESPTK